MSCSRFPRISWQNGKPIGIGRSLTAPPSHPTWHTGPYQGGSVWLHVVVSTESEQSPLIKEVMVERHAYARCMTDLPWPFRPPGRRVRQRLGNPPLDQLCLTAAVPLPVLPLEATETVTTPAVQVAQHCGRLAAPTIAKPSSQIRCEGRDDVLEAAALIPSWECFHPRFAPGQGLWSDFPSCGALSSRKATPAEAPLPGAVDGPLIPVHLQRQAPRDEATEARQPPRPGSGPPPVDSAIIRVPTKAVTAVLAFLVQLVHHPVGKERCKGGALGRTLRGESPETIFYNACLQKRPEKLADSLSGDPLGQATHQPVRTDAVEKCLSVESHDVAVALLKVGVGLGNRLVLLR
jgi:hypothetical protein